MNAPDPSRRQIIASLAVLPAMSASVIAVAADNPDREILELWNMRQTALAAIERRGSFFESEQHSPKEVEKLDYAEDKILKLPAQTPEGVMAKLWVGLGYIGDSHTDSERQAHDIMRRADLAEVTALEPSLDIDYLCVISAIRDLTNMVGKTS